MSDAFASVPQEEGLAEIDRIASEERPKRKRA